MRDRRNTKILGETLLFERERPHLRDLPLSEAYDHLAPWLDRTPDYVGDEFMSSDPADHHSKTPQGEDWQ